MTTPAARTTFRFYKGATFSTEEIDLLDTDGDPEDISAWSGRLRVWREDDDPSTATPLFDSDTGDDIELTLGGVLGTVVGTIAADITVDVDVDIDGETWYARLEMTDGADVVTRTIEGYVIAQP